MAYIKTKKSLWDRHSRCPVYIDYDYRPKRTTGFNKFCQENGSKAITAPALMCACHGKWIKWLSFTEAQAMESVGAEVRGRRTRYDNY
jgi:hypothetical protein